MVISYALKKEQEGCRRLCENTKGGHELKTVEKHCIRKYGPLLNAPSQKGSRAKLIAHPRCRAFLWNLLSFFRKWVSVGFSGKKSNLGKQSTH